jgi:hypothetical protein
MAAGPAVTPAELAGSPVAVSTVAVFTAVDHASDLSRLASAAAGRDRSPQCRVSPFSATSRGRGASSAP